MEALSLEELKAQNAAEEAGNAGVPQTPDTEAELNADKGETGQIVQEAEPDEDSEKPESEAWQLSDDEGSQKGEQFVPVAAHAKLRAKLKGKIGEKNAEIEALQAKTAELERKLNERQSVSVQSDGERPKPEDFNTDEAYEDAREEWLLKRLSGEQKTERQEALKKQAQQEQNAKISEIVNAHYIRAVQLAEQNNILAENYQAADMAFRTTIDNAFPGTGDTLADQLIARMGEGSEKLVYYIGRSPRAQRQISDALQSDPTGLSASILLGRMMGEKVGGSGKKVSRAPAPADTARGDVAVNPDSRALKKQYDKASKSGDQQAAIDARLAARRQGFDVSSW